VGAAREGLPLLLAQGTGESLMLGEAEGQPLPLRLVEALREGLAERVPLLLELAQREEEGVGVAVPCLVAVAAALPLPFPLPLVELRAGVAVVQALGGGVLLEVVLEVEDALALAEEEREIKAVALAETEM
jgi:hypothetical protein